MTVGHPSQLNSVDVNRLGIGCVFSNEYFAFKISALIHDTRIELGLTQEELANKVGTTKSYISKIENNLKEARISTLQKIVELGFGGN
jgi:DNA-binding XRE family transcriptional regulator